MPREKDNWDPRAVNLEGRYQTKEKWHDRDGNELHPHTNYYVGGNTKFFGAALFRLRKEDFGEIKHHGGLSPAWPISYDELETYYTEAERLYHVHGNAGEDPTEPRRSTPYPHPAVSHEPRLQQLSNDFESLGLCPFHTPLGCPFQAWSLAELLRLERVVLADNTKSITRASLSCAPTSEVKHSRG